MESEVEVDSDEKILVEDSEDSETDDNIEVFEEATAAFEAIVVSDAAAVSNGHAMVVCCCCCCC